MPGRDKPPPDLGAKFEVLEPIGSGGMGVVYRVRHRGLDQIRAIKVLAGDASPSATERLRREAATAIQLAHPNIVTVYDLEELPDGGLAIVMEFLTGEGLDSLVQRDGPLEIERICWMFRGVCDALDLMHRAGVIHRDLKPSNLFVCDDGTLKILDFGVSRMLEQASELTQPGRAIGTPAFMAPEQYEGQELTPRTDAYALSAVLYYALTGQPPLRANTKAELVTRVLLTEPPLASELRGDLPVGAAEALARGLAKAPEQRFETARELLDSFEHGLAAPGAGFDPRDPPPPGMAPQEGRTTGRSWTRIGGWAALACLVVGALAVAWNVTRSPGPLPWSEPPSLIRFVEEPGFQLNPALSPDGTQIVYADLTDLFLKPTGGGPARNLTADFDPASRQPAWSRDGTQLAFVGDHTLYVMDTGEWQPRPVLEGAHWPTWSPDGKSLAYTTGDLGPPYLQTRVESQLWTVDVESGEQRCLRADGKAYLPDWSPSGDRIAFNDAMTIWTIRPDGSELTQLLQDRAWSPAWLSGADRLFVATNRGDMTAVNLMHVGDAGEHDQEILSIPLSADFAGDVSVSADDRTLAFTVIQNTTHLHRVTLDPASAMPLDTLRPVTSGNRRYACPGFSPDGQAIVYTSYGKHENIHVARIDGTEGRALSAGETTTRGPRWSPDGQTLVFYGIREGRQGLWSVDRDGGSLRCLYSDEALDSLVPLWSPDGSRLAFTDSSPQPFVIDLERDWEEQVAEQRRAEVQGWFATSWSPDGRWLAVSKSGTGIGRMDVATGAIEPLVARGYYPIWMSDSRRMLVGDNDRVFVLDAETREVSDILLLAPGHIPGTTSMALSPDDRTLIVAVNQADADIWLAESSPSAP